MSEFFPPFIRSLPVPDSPVDMDARIVPSVHVLTMFYEIGEPVEVPAHRHGPQWGVVLEGSMELDIEGDTRTYRRGDTYFVPDGALHTVRISAGYKGVDVFADAKRYEPRDVGGRLP